MAESGSAAAAIPALDPRSSPFGTGSLSANRSGNAAAPGPLVFPLAKSAALISDGSDEHKDSGTR